MRLALSLVLTACAVGLSAQQSRPPQFRGGTDLVAIDFLAVRDDGRPVTDLKADEIVLRVDGKPRDIRSFQFVKVAPLSVAILIASTAVNPASTSSSICRPLE